MHGNNNEDSEKQDVVTNILFEAIVSSIKKNLFCQSMVGFLIQYSSVITNIKLMEL